MNVKRNGIKLYLSVLSIAFLCTGIFLLIWCVINQISFQSLGFGDHPLFYLVMGLILFVSSFVFDEKDVMMEEKRL